MLEHGRREDKSRILLVISEGIVAYSKNKQSSNVVEKCFEISSIGEHAQQLEQERQQLYRVVLEGGALRPMIDDKFGNYIVQRMIENSKGEDRVKLRDALLN